MYNCKDCLFIITPTIWVETLITFDDGIKTEERRIKRTHKYIYMKFCWNVGWSWQLTSISLI